MNARLHELTLTGPSAWARGNGQPSFRGKQTDTQ